MKTLMILAVFITISQAAILPVEKLIKHECETAEDCKPEQCCKYDYTGMIASKRQLLIKEAIRKCMDYLPEGSDCGGLNTDSCGCEKNTTCTHGPDPTLELMTKPIDIANSKRDLFPGRMVAGRIAFGTFECRKNEN